MKNRILKAPRAPDVICGVVSGLLLFLSFPPADLSFLAWAAPIPILWAAVKDPRRAAVPAYLGGAIWFLGGLAWVWHATGPGMIFLGMFLALYLVAFAVAAGVLRRRLNIPLAIIAPIVWVTLETIRSNFMTGFPYLLLGHTQINNLTLMQILDITGVYGVSFLVMSCSGLLAEIALAFDSRAWRPVGISAAVVAAGLVGTVIYGHQRLGTIETKPGPEVCLVQANTPQDVKNVWSYEAACYEMQKYTKLTYRCLKDAKGASPLVIWPESALPGFYNNLTSPWINTMRSKLDSMLRAYKIRRMLIGMNYLGPEGEERKFFNSAVYINGRYDDHERYDKIHLVPFGEYVPLARLLFFVKGVVPYEQPFSAGRDYKLFDYEGEKFAVLICYEDVFPGLVRRFVAKGAGFLVNISNEGWFYRSAEADQHLAIARCRAIENRVGMVRATNSGISCLIDPVGNVEKKIEKDGQVKLVEGWLCGRVTLGGSSATVYTRFGDVFALLCVACTLAAAMAALLSGRRTILRRRAVEPSQSLYREKPPS